MSIFIVILIAGYIAASLRRIPDVLQYGLFVGHAVLIAGLFVNVKVSDPKLGLLLVGGIVSATSLFISRKPKWKTMVSPLMGLVSVLLALSLFAPVPSNSPIEVETWVALHIVLVLFGYLGCIAAGLLSAVYIFVQNSLKAKSLKIVVHYPSLSLLEKYFSVGIWLGVLGLFTGVTSGILWGIHTTNLEWDFTTISSVFLLFWYSIALIGQVSGRSKHWSAWMSILGVTGLLVYFFLSAVIGSWHVGGI